MKNDNAQPEPMFTIKIEPGSMGDVILVARGNGRYDIVRAPAVPVAEPKRRRPRAVSALTDWARAQGRARADLERAMEGKARTLLKHLVERFGEERLAEVQLSTPISMLVATPIVKIEKALRSKGFLFDRNRLVEWMVEHAEHESVKFLNSKYKNCEKDAQFLKRMNKYLAQNLPPRVHARRSTRRNNTVPLRPVQLQQRPGL